jgi:hypothetical protein
MACMVPQQSSPVLPSRTCSGWLNTSIPRFSYFAAGLGDKTHVLNFFCFFLYFFFLCVVQINCKETKYRTTPMECNCYFFVANKNTQENSSFVLRPVGSQPQILW